MIFSSDSILYQPGEKVLPSFPPTSYGLDPVREIIIIYSIEAADRRRRTLCRIGISGSLNFSEQKSSIIGIAYQLSLKHWKIGQFINCVDRITTVTLECRTDKTIANSCVNESERWTITHTECSVERPSGVYGVSRESPFRRANAGMVPPVPTRLPYAPFTAQA